MNPAGGTPQLLRVQLQSLAATLALTLAGSAQAQVVHDHAHDAEPAARTFELPEPAADLVTFIEADYRSQAEKAALRVEHGLWTQADLSTPELTARAMLIAGQPKHPSLDVPRVNALDRAEALVQRGALQQALDLIEGETSMRAQRLRAEALELQGHYDLADQAVDPIVEALTRRAIDDADALIDGVLALMVRSRVRGPSRPDEPGSAAADFRTLNQLLARARDELDRQSWRARAVEAELLYERANLPQAAEAAADALARNPRAARVWNLLATIALDRWDFARANAIADVMDTLALGTGPQPAAAPPSGDSPALPYAQLIRARAALQQNDVDLADALVTAVLEQMPSHPHARALQAAVVASRFDDAALEDVLDAFDQMAGGEPHHALLEAAQRLSRARQYEASASLFGRAIERQPNLAQAWSELGLLYMQAGRDRDALDALRRAAQLDPFHTQAVNSLALVEQLVQWPTVESEHFVVRYREGIDELLAREMLPVLEEIHTRVTGPGGFDHEPSQRTTIELMPDHATFAVRITGMPALHTVAAATGPTIALESPQEGPGFSTGTFDWPRVLEHEYAHTVTLSRTRNRIPHWFTEAAAVWMEQSPRPWSWWQLLERAYKSDELFGMDEISLRFVRPLKPGDRTQAYAQGHWMYEFMVQAFGREAPLKLMDRYAQGMPQNEAMREVLGVDEQTFFEAFLEYARDELLAAGLLLPEGVPSLAELASAAGIDLDQPPEQWDEQTLAGWLAAHPEHPEVLRARVQQRLSQRGDRPIREMPDLIPLLGRLAEACPVDPLPRRQLARFALQGVFDRSGEEGTRLAIEHLSFLDERQTSTHVYARALAERYADLGDLENAWLSVQRAVNIAPFDPALRELAATIAVQTKQWDEAERMLTVLARLEPDRPIHARRLKALQRVRTDN